MLVNGSTPGITATSGTNDSGAYNPVQEDSVFTYGLEVLFSFMETMSAQANSQYTAMKNNSDAARDVQGLASEVDSVLANLSNDDAGATAKLTDDVIKYLKDNNVDVANVDDPSGQLNRGQLTAVKSALDNIANRATDFVSTAQLQLQKQMQTYNVCVSLINSMQSMLSEMNKSIAQGIR